MYRCTREPPWREPVRCSVHGARPADPGCGRRGPGRHTSRCRARPGGAARAVGPDDGGAAGGGRGLRRRPSRRHRPGRAHAHRARRTASGSWRHWAGPPPTRRWLVAARLGFAEGDEPAELMVSSIGGNNPEALMHDACLAISRGERDVVLVTGAEAMYARALAWRDPARPWLEWASQPEGHAAGDTLRCGEGRCHRARDAARGDPADSRLPLVRERPARRQRAGRCPSTAARIGGLWSRFSEVAAGNPHAWIRTARTPDEIVTPTPGNRMVSFPYPKLCTANMQVDQGAAFIVCSVAAARAAGVPEERWVFPLAGADGNDHWFISDRPELHRSPAIGLAGSAALQQAGHRDRRRRLRRPVLVLPRGRADGGQRAGARPRRPGSPADPDRRADLRRWAG